MRMLLGFVPAVTGLLLAAQPAAAATTTVEWLAGPLVFNVGNSPDTAKVLVGDGGTAAAVGAQITYGQITSNLVPLSTASNRYPCP